MVDLTLQVLGNWGANGAGVYVIDNSDEGYNFNITAQLRKQFDFGLSANLAYSYLDAQNIWNDLNTFIEQDDYLSQHRGEIAERNGLVNPRYFNIDLRILQDFSIQAFGKKNTLQLSVDILNVANLINSSWKQVASTAATSPLALDCFGADGEPVFNFSGVKETFVDNVSLFSRWQMQIGLRYMFN